MKTTSCMHQAQTDLIEASTLLIVLNLLTAVVYFNSDNLALPVVNGYDRIK